MWYRKGSWLLILVTFFGGWDLAEPGDPVEDPLFEFPHELTPEFIGEEVVENLLARDHMMRARDPGIHYAEVCTADGAIHFAGLTGDKDLMSRLIQRYSCYVDSADCSLIPGAHQSYIGAYNVLSMYTYNREERYLDRVMELVQGKWRSRAEDLDPATGLPSRTRFWSDDMYFTPTMDSRIYLITGDPKCTERVVTLLKAYIDTLQLPNGLFKHTTKVDFLWARGVGWSAAGITEALLALPGDHPDYNYLMNSYLRLMEGLLPYQSENGLWRQILDDPEAWEETSGTGMFAFALITGIKRGWLDRSVYGQAARNAWLGLARNVNEDGELEKVCIGTNQKFTAQEYLDRPRRAGDFHGQAAILWAASALLR